MGGNEGAGQPQFTGIAKYFNSHTIIGRRNCVYATYGTIAGIILVYKFYKSKKAPDTEKA
ncbi:hypothetical protein PAMA_016010 [Pampus argenteus]